MNAPVEKPAEQAASLAESGRPQSPSAPGNDSWVKKIDSFGIVKSLGIGAVLLSGAGWVIHSYALPAALSVWEEMIRPRVDSLIIEELQRSPGIHDFMVAEINKYLTGEIASSKERPSEVGAKIKTLVNSSEQIETISNSLFGGVDSAYAISAEYPLIQTKDKSKNTIAFINKDRTTGPVRLFVYADPSQHCIYAYVRANGDLQRGIRTEHVNLTIKLNGTPLKAAINQPAFGGEIGKFIKPHQGTGGGGKNEEDDNKSYTDDVQRIEIVPQFPTFDPIQIVGSPENVPDEDQAVTAGLEGYILVTRRRLGSQVDCQQNPATASSGYGLH